MVIKEEDLFSIQYNNHQRLDRGPVLEVEEDGCDDPLPVESPQDLYKLITQREKELGYHHYVSFEEIPFFSCGYTDSGIPFVTTPLMRGAAQVIANYFHNEGIPFSFCSMDYDPEQNLMVLSYTDPDHNHYVARIGIDIEIVKLVLDEKDFWNLPVSSFCLVLAVVDGMEGEETGDVPGIYDSSEDLLGVLDQVYFVDIPELLKDCGVRNSYSSFISQYASDYVYEQGPRFYRYIF